MRNVAAFCFLLLAFKAAGQTNSGLSAYQSIVNDAHGKGDFDGVVVISEDGKLFSPPMRIGSV